MKHVLFLVGLVFLHLFLLGNMHAQQVPPGNDVCNGPPGSIRWSVKFPNLVDGDNVVINTGEIVYLDVVTPKLDGIEIKGSLIFTDCIQGVPPLITPELRSNRILVTGLLQIGSAAEPFEDDAIITLVDQPIVHTYTGYGQEVLEALADRGLVVTKNGVLRMFGESRGVSWTRLKVDETVMGSRSGSPSTDVKLDIDVQAQGWSTNDSFVIASTDFDWLQAEEFNASAVLGDTLTLTSPLEYDHWSKTYEATGSSPLLQIEERAEVGLLTRNILVRGEDNNDSEYLNHFGHIMLLINDPAVPDGTPTAEVSWVAFERLGVEWKPSRYAFHFHRTQASHGSFIENSSFFECFNHFVVIHDAQGIRLENNVGYKGASHGFYLQGFDAYDNEVVNNLGIGTFRPRDEYFGGTDPEFSELEPAVFYFANPDNKIHDNVAAGSSHYGYWLDLEGAPIAVLDLNQGEIDFVGNHAHSNQEMGFYQDLRPVFSGFTYANPTVEDFSTYKNRRYGLWNRGYGKIYLKDIRVADSRAGFYLASDGVLQYLGNPFNLIFPRSQSTLDESLVIGETENYGLGQYDYDMAAGGPFTDPMMFQYPDRDRPEHEEDWGVSPNEGRSLPQVGPHFLENGDQHDMKWDALCGVELYDGFIEVEDSWFMDFQDALLKNMSSLEEDYRRSGAFSQVAYDSPFVEDPRNRVRRLDLSNNVANKVFYRFPYTPTVWPATPRGDNMIFNTVVYDEDGSLSGTADAYIMPINAFLYHGVTNSAAGLQARLVAASDADYAQIVVEGRTVPSTSFIPNHMRVEHGMPNQAGFGSLPYQHVDKTPESEGPPYYGFNALSNTFDSAANTGGYTLSYPEYTFDSTKWPTELNIIYRFTEHIGDVVYLAIPLANLPVFPGGVYFDDILTGAESSFPDLDNVQNGWWYDSTSRLAYVKITAGVSNGQGFNWDGTETVCRVASQ